MIMFILIVGIALITIWSGIDMLRQINRIPNDEDQRQ